MSGLGILTHSPPRKTAGFDGYFPVPAKWPFGRLRPTSASPGCAGLYKSQAPRYGHHVANSRAGGRHFLAATHTAQTCCYEMAAQAKPRKAAISGHIGFFKKVPAVHQGVR